MNPIMQLGIAFAILVAIVSALLGYRPTTGGPTSPPGDVPCSQSAPDCAPGPLGTRALGVYTADQLFDLGQVSDFQSAVGTPVTFVDQFVSWEYDGADGAALSRFPTYRAQQAVQRGYVPTISWDPNNPADGPDQPQFAYARIAAGAFDGYVAEFAAAARSLGSPVVIRFAHEMNLPGSSYSEVRSGNTQGSFVAAWRHLHDVFDRVGADNVVWEWAPNIISARTTDLAGLFPGAAYVDQVGVDGYSYALAGCLPATEVFGPTLAQVRAFWRGPLALSEVAVAEQCGDKATWIRQMFDWLEEEPDVVAVRWWNRDDPASTWRVTSSPEALQAFRAGVASWLGRG